MTRYRSRQAETEDVNPRRLRRGSVFRQHLTRWAVGHDELAPGIVGDIHLHPTTIETIREIGGGSGVGQLLVLSATAVDIDDEGYVTFDTISHQKGFADVTAAGDSVIWPVSAVGGVIVTFAWATFTGGGTIEVEVDGAVPAWGTVAAGASGSEGRGEIGVDIAEGSTVRLKVTHGEVAAQTATVTMYLKVEDPLFSTPVAPTPGEPEVVETLWLDSQLHSTASATYVESTVPLDVGVVYTVVVTGNYTNYPFATLAPVNIPIVFLSPGGGANRDSSNDAEVWYAATAPDHATRPSHSDGLKFDIGDGAGFVHPEPVGGPFATIQTGHVYTYTITDGVGQPLKAAISDTPIGDNNGMLKIEIYR
jgi:hypothetical protein